MFKIGEFSKLTQVSIRMLRYYDEVGLLKPAEIDPFTNYRLYSIEQIPVLQKIVLLRDMDFSTLEITDAVCQWDKISITQRLEQKKKEISQLINQEQIRIAKINLAIKDIENEKIAIHYNVVLKSVPSYKVLSLRRVIPNYFCEGELWKELGDFAVTQQIALSHGHENMAIYYDNDSNCEGVDIEVCMAVKKIEQNKKEFVFRKTEPVDTMACAMVYGPYENIASAYHSFALWLQQHNQYKMYGQSRQISHRGPDNESDGRNYLTEIQIPVKIPLDSPIV